MEVALAALLLAAFNSIAADGGSISGNGVAGHFSQTLQRASFENISENELQLPPLARFASLTPAQRAGGGGGTPGPAGDAALHGVIDNIIDKLLEAIANAIGGRMPLGDFGFNLDYPAAKGRVSFKSALARNMGHIAIATTRGKLLNYKVGVGLPHLSLATLYDADVNVEYGEDRDGSRIRIFGAGPARVDLFHIKIDTDVSVSLKHLSVKVKNMKLSLESDKVKLQGLFGGGDIDKRMSDMATSLLPALVQEFQQEITNFLMEYINECYLQITRQHCPHKHQITG